MENKNYKGLVWLVVILIVLVVALMGFIVYKEFYGEEKPNVDNTTTNNVVENNENQIKNINDFPKANSNGIKSYNLYRELFGNEIMTKFNEKTINIENIEFKAICIQTDDITGDGVEECIETDIYMNSSKIYTIDWETGNYDFLITSDYVIFQDGGAFIYPGNIEIFDKNGKIIKSVANTNKGYALSAGGEENDTTIKIVDNNLYFITSTDIGPSLYDIKFKYIDLNTLDEYTIQKFQGWTNQQE